MSRFDTITNGLYSLERKKKRIIKQCHSGFNYETFFYPAQSSQAQGDVHQLAGDINFCKL